MFLSLLTVLSAQAQDIDLTIDELVARCDHDGTAYVSVVDVTLSNLGSSSSGSFYIDVFVGNASPPTIGSYGDTYTWVSDLGPGSEITRELTIPETVTWTYPWIDALVDTDGFVSEGDETNNSAYIYQEPMSCTPTCTKSVQSPGFAANPRAGGRLVCDYAAGETVAAVFYEDLYTYPRDWVDGVGITCVGPAGARDVYNLPSGNDLDLQDPVHTLDCGGNLPTGLVYAELTEASRTRMDGLGLWCDNTLDLPTTDAFGPLHGLSCPDGEFLVGVHYKGAWTIDGTWSDSTSDLAAICSGDAPWDPQVVADTHMESNSRQAGTLVCPDGVPFEGLLLDAHDTPYADWIDGAGASCTNFDLYVTADVFDDSTDDTRLACSSGEPIGFGVGRVELFPGIERVDGVVLYCDDGESIPSEPGLVVEYDLYCPADEIMVGVSYKGGDTEDGTWSDAVDALAPVCSPTVCE